MRYRFASCSIVLVLIGIAFAQTPTTADSPACGARANNTLDKLLDCVTVDGMMAHRTEIAQANANALALLHHQCVGAGEGASIHGQYGEVRHLVRVRT